MGRITIKQIAEDLGLSRNTVSMALSNNPKVTRKTRERIISYAVSAGYSKLSDDAEALVAEQKQLHILVLRRIDQTAYWDRVINGVSAEAAEFNYVLNISAVTQEQIDSFTLPIGYSDEIDVIVFLHKFGDSYVQFLLKDTKIGIFLDSMDYTRMEPVRGDVIKSEGHRSMMAITRSLIDQGCTKIAYMSPYYINAETFLDRYEGFCAAMHSAGLPILPEYVVTSSPYPDKSLAFRKALEQLPDLPEAIICSNDLAATQITHLLMEKGYRVPRDVLVTGFDNDEFDAFSPFFTTADCDAIMLGRRIIQQLNWRMEHRDAPFEIITVCSTPIYRKSSRKPQVSN